MNLTEFLEKIDLIDHLELKLNVSKDEFIKALSSNLDEDKFRYFEELSSSKNVYAGDVDDSTFKIWKKRSFTDANQNGGRFTGHFYEQGNELIINITIDVHSSKLNKMFIVIMLTFMCLYFFLIFFNKVKTEFFVRAFLFIHACLMTVMFYFYFRNIVKKLKYNIERDLYFMLK